MGQYWCQVLLSIVSSIVLPGTLVPDTRYPGITCKNQPRLYFSVGLKYRSTADGKIP